MNSSNQLFFVYDVQVYVVVFICFDVHLCPLYFSLLHSVVFHAFVDVCSLIFVQFLPFAVHASKTTVKRCMINIRHLLLCVFCIIL